MLGARSSLQITTFSVVGFIEWTQGYLVDPRVLSWREDLNGWFILTMARPGVDEEQISMRFAGEYEAPGRKPVPMLELLWKEQSLLIQADAMAVAELITA